MNINDFFEVIKQSLFVDTRTIQINDMFYCFGLQLSREALSIYNTYLSDSATLPVNIDDTARVDEQTLETPHPGMFQKAQQQVRAMGQLLGQQPQNCETTSRGILISIHWSHLGEMGDDS